MKNLDEDENNRRTGAKRCYKDFDLLLVRKKEIIVCNFFPELDPVEISQQKCTEKNENEKKFIPVGRRRGGHYAVTFRRTAFAGRPS